MITIGLLTNDITSANYGVNALSISNLLFLEEICKINAIEHNYIIFDNPNKKSQYIDILSKIVGLEHIDFNLVQQLQFRKPFKTYFSFKKNIKCCDIIFDTSGGDSFADIYGDNRILHQILPKIIVNNCKIPLVFTPQTIGPFNKGIWKFIARSVTQRSQVVYARDKLSYKYCIQELKLHNVIEVTDMAMRLPYVIDARHELKHKLRIGINVSGLLYSGGYNQNNQFNLRNSYSDLIYDLIKTLESTYDCEIHLIPHVITNTIEGDNTVCDFLKKDFPDLIYDGVFSGPINAKTYISNMDIFIGSRMHSTIAALSSGVPTIPLSYSRKFEGLFSSLGYNECVNLKEYDTDQVIKKVLEKIDNIDDLKLSVEKANFVAQNRLKIFSDSLNGIFVNIVGSQIDNQ